MVDRIKQVMEYYEETPAEFAEKIGVNRSNLTHVFTGRNQPSLDFAKKVLVAFPEVSTEWLIMGVGKMIKDPEEIMPAKREFIQTELFGIEEEAVPSKEVENEFVPETFGKDVVEKDTFDENPLVNVKSDTTDIPTVERIKSVDTEYVKPIEQSSVTVLESNIPQQVVQEVGKNDSQQVDKLPDPDEQTSICPGQRSSEPPQSKPEEKTPTLKEKKIEKIIFFYDDDSFKVYHP